MGRRPSINRDQVLALAERIVAERGAAALTIEAVAQAAGISKGGVQSCFGTKEAMIGAMLDRWFQDYAIGLAAELDGQESLAAHMAAHLALSLDATDDSPARGAALLAALLQHPEQLHAVRAWYAERFAGLFEAGAAGRALRLALLAIEGAVLLRHFGLAQLDAGQWSVLRDDIASLIRV
ncbi:TetR/AcrR family transcriptional regulator [Roseococcus sp. SDR]|uniref:TetR/AcrR family transcriptional regulator n=1 Tax=Roseococcus sp. SDR TaxID=2835532 RepID=UPI001BCC3D66|nr:TetR/AcrR family transcriptional regulator [Roseococcus sp. SDR]MBS7790915.1 TetR/AcrR family transcriptional regulator [Roseococcus sp. SDR]MBV1846229.1 TetR/AcrR family transcriptional regulator [Roseococcus sp. SDR]